MKKSTTEILKQRNWHQCFKQGIIGTVAILLLTGCDSIKEIVTDLPIPNFGSTEQPAVQAPPQSATSAEMEEQVRQQINAIREKEGLSQLRNNEKLAEVARNYSQKMAEQNFFSHTSPEGSTMVQRVNSAGIFYFIIGENLFKGTNLSQPVQIAVKGWMESPGHRKNILRSEYRETGIGVWRQGNTYYFTQLFMRSIN